MYSCALNPNLTSSLQVFKINDVKDVKKKTIFGLIHAFILEISNFSEYLELYHLKVQILFFKIYFELCQYDILFLRYMILNITESQMIVATTSQILLCWITILM